MFSSGQKTFALLFFFSFVVAMIWAYRKDKRINALFYKGSYKVLIVVVLIFFAFYGIVKIKHMLYP